MLGRCRLGGYDETEKFSNLYCKQRLNLTQTMGAAMALKQYIKYRIKYFSARLDFYFLEGGASRCYKGFRGWHRSALLALLFSGVDPRQSNFFETEESKLIDASLWRDTNQLPENFMDEMDGFQVDQEHLGWFLNEISIQIKKHKNMQELIGWENFLEENKERFKDFKKSEIQKKLL